MSIIPEDYGIGKFTMNRIIVHEFVIVRIVDIINHPYYLVVFFFTRLCNYYCKMFLV